MDNIVQTNPSLQMDVDHNRDRHLFAGGPANLASRRRLEHSNLIPSCQCPLLPPHLAAHSPAPTPSPLLLRHQSRLARQPIHRQLKSLRRTAIAITSQRSIRGLVDPSIGLFALVEPDSLTNPKQQDILSHYFLPDHTLTVTRLSPPWRKWM